ncbi:4585_t:CDS:2, partial [Dentiscutata erythropus]
RSPDYNSTELNHSQSSTIQQENRPLESLRSVFIRKQLSDKGFYEGAFNLYSAAYDSEVSKTVSSNIGVWCNWCKQKNQDPTSYDLGHRPPADPKICDIPKLRNSETPNIESNPIFP